VRMHCVRMPWGRMPWGECLGENALGRMPWGECLVGECLVGECLGVECFEGECLVKNALIELLAIKCHLVTIVTFCQRFCGRMPYGERHGCCMADGKMPLVRMPFVVSLR
jgi:hypothetical protein